MSEGLPPTEAFPQRLPDGRVRNGAKEEEEERPRVPEYLPDGRPMPRGPRSKGSQVLVDDRLLPWITHLPRGVVEAFAYLWREAVELDAEFPGMFQDVRNWLEYQLRLLPSVGGKRAMQVENVERAHGMDPMMGGAGAGAWSPQPPSPSEPERPRRGRFGLP
jgi:hypothetical protein